MQILESWIPGALTNHNISLVSSSLITFQDFFSVRIYSIEYIVQVSHYILVTPLKFNYIDFHTLNVILALLRDRPRTGGIIKPS